MLQGYGGGGGGIPCLGKSESATSGATKPVPFLKKAQINYAGLANSAHERQWTVAVISWWTLLNIMIRRKAAMCGQHKEHADISMYFSTSATSMGNELSLTKSSGMVQVSKGTA